MARKKIRIGELLVENRVISEAQLKAALESQKTALDHGCSRASFWAPS